MDKCRFVFNIQIKQCLILGGQKLAKPWAVEIFFQCCQGGKAGDFFFFVNFLEKKKVWVR